jgi:hypothetical protein
MKAHKFAFAVPLACAVAAVACSKSPPPQVPGSTSMQPVDTETAVRRIAAARCKHATACNEIGGKKTFPSMQACMGKNRSDAEDDLRTANCPRGVNAARLQSCVSAVEAESCSGLGSGFNRGLACKTTELCP